MADQISSIEDAHGNDDSDDEGDDGNEALPEDEVLDEIDVEEGVAYEDRTNDSWTLTDFEDPDVIPLFDGEWGANRAKMREMNCNSCLDSFACYFDDEIVSTFVTATENFGSRYFGRSWKHLDVNEFKSFFSIILVLGLIPVTSRDCAWGDDGLEIRFVKILMTKGRFNQILRAWRYEDESMMTEDQIRRNVRQSPFWYVQRFIDSLRVRFRDMYQLGQKVDIDEQCIPFKGRHICRCYNPNKPEKWHFRVFVLSCAFSGYMADAYNYEGIKENRPRDVPATLFPIHKLFQPIERYFNKGHIVATDNWYTSMAALTYIRDTLSNHFVGTCKANKQGIPKDGIFPKVGRGKQRRGASKQMVKNDNGKKAYFVAWQDNKPVHILSTIKSGHAECYRRLQNDVTKQWDRVPIPQPSIVQLYNTTMGGTDSFDQRLAYYRPSLKTKRYPPRIFTHFLNASVVNAFIIHKQFHNTPKTFQLRHFIKKLVYDLVPDLSRELPVARIPQFGRKLKAWEIDRTRLDKVFDHFPLIEENPDDTSNDKHFRNSCVLCGKKVGTRCSTCGAYLCTKQKWSVGAKVDNCWAKFHTCAILTKEG